ncbi:hypothetical protein J6590_001925 [Homalodisca vitripennis]|nr:hypothetical protein J6590_001925 [Homalodisca vitripennis]
MNTGQDATMIETARVINHLWVVWQSIASWMPEPRHVYYFSYCSYCFPILQPSLLGQSLRTHLKVVEQEYYFITPPRATLDMTKGSHPSGNSILTHRDGEPETRGAFADLINKKQTPVLIKWLKAYTHSSYKGLSIPFLDEKTSR